MTVTPMAPGTSTSDDSPNPGVSALSFDLLRVTEAAALAAFDWVGRGDKNAGDQAAVDAMRGAFATVPIRGRIIIGEGEKDEAPMLANGENVGNRTGPAVDIAVDPVDGTTLLAHGRPNAIAVLAAAPGGAMLDMSASHYMEKLVVGTALADVVDLRQPIEDNIRDAAKHTGRRVDQLTICVLDRPRHRDLVVRIRRTGARVILFPDGDVAAGVAAASPDSSVDMLVGVGGSPEGVITACAVKAVGGLLQARVGPQSPTAAKPVETAGYDAAQILTQDDLVQGDDVLFVATGITGGDLVGGVQHRNGLLRTASLVLTSHRRSVRHVETQHISAQTATQSRASSIVSI